MFISASTFSLPLLAFSDLLSTGLASPAYDLPTGTCTTTQRRGQSVYCCDGACFDGTTIFDKAGLCKTWDDLCSDATPAPCSYNQVFMNTHETTVASGDGGCYDGNDCVWEAFEYSWDCCQCPTGYIGVGTTCATQNLNRYSGLCFACTDVDETAIFNPVSQTYVCDGPGFQKTACKMLKANSDLISNVGVWVTWLGALCAVPNIPNAVSNTITLLEDAVAIANYYTGTGNPNGITGTKFGLATTLITTVSSLALAEAVAIGVGTSLPIDAWLVGLYTSACTADLAIGLALTLILEPLNFDHNCTAFDSRSVLLEAGSIDRVEARAELTARNASYNPCAEFLSYFPNNHIIAAAVEAGCSDVSQYNSEETFSAGVANTTASLQQFCGQYRSNMTLFDDFDAVLVALQNMVPYCDNSTLASATSSSTSPTNSPSPTSTSKPTASSKSTTSKSTTSKSTSTPKPTTSSKPTTTSKSTTTSKPTTSKPTTSKSTSSSKPTT